MVTLGKTSLSVSEIGLGADHFGTAVSDADAAYFLDAFVDAGGNLIDTANIYGKWVPGAGNASERFLGKWLKKTKKSVIIATKGAHYHLHTPQKMRLSYDEIVSDLDESLLTLGLDHIDLYWLHRDDPTREIGEIIETMEDLVARGKIRYYGASNYTAERLFEAERYARAKSLIGFSAVSNRFSPIRENPLPQGDATLVVSREKELRFHRETGCPMIPYQATARGYFSKLQEGSVSASLAAQYDNPENRLLYERLLAFSQDNACSMQTAVLYAGATQDIQTIPLTSVRKREHMRDITDALALLRMHR
ncbi:MAG: aldo/keto reductase [Clostridia bacterium]|nr:aldo/keto reductase [Clostridia bacterium]